MYICMGIDAYTCTRIFCNFSHANFTICSAMCVRRGRSVVTSHPGWSQYCSHSHKCSHRKSSRQTDASIANMYNHLTVVSTKCKHFTPNAPSLTYFCYMLSYWYWLICYGGIVYFIFSIRSCNYVFSFIHYTSIRKWLIENWR